MTRFNDLTSFRDFINRKDWFLEHLMLGRPHLVQATFSAFMEIHAAPARELNHRQNDLLRAAFDSQIQTFGWPIGLVLDGEYKPKPTSNGIFAEVLRNQDDQKSFDYWAIRKSGEFYFVASLFEDLRDLEKLRPKMALRDDERTPNVIFFDTRIIKTTEAFLYLHNLYTKLGVEADEEVGVSITHSGLRDRMLIAASPFRFPQPKRTVENQISETLVTSLSDLRTNIVSHVKNFLDPLFMVFEYAEVGQETYDELINNFIEGRIK